MAGDMPSPGDPASSFGNRDDLFGHGEWIPNPSPPIDLSTLANLDEYFDDELIVDPKILRSQEDNQAVLDSENVALHALADKQQDDPLQDLTPPKRSTVALNDEFRPLLGIPKAGITTYPLEDTEERPSKRTRFTDIEDDRRGSRDGDFQTAILEAYSTCKTSDPSYQQKTKLADFLEVEFQEIDEWFRERRSATRAPLASQLPGIKHFLDNDRESTVSKSNFQDAECFTEAGEPKIPSETNPTKTSTSAQGRPCHCTYTGCSETFKSPSAWERHERDVHWGQNKFLCLLCGVSEDVDQGRFSCAACFETFPELSSCVVHTLGCEEARRQHSVRRKRHTGLKHHLDVEHPGEEQRRALFEKARRTEEWHYPVETGWPRVCTYINCSKSFQTWKERSEHYSSNHFPKSKRSSRRSFTSIQYDGES